MAGDTDIALAPDDDGLGTELLQYILVPKEPDLQHAVLASLAETPVSSYATEFARRYLAEHPEPPEEKTSEADGVAPLAATFEFDKEGEVILVFTPPALRQALRRVYFESGWTAIQSLYAAVVTWAKKSVKPGQMASDKRAEPTPSVRIDQAIDALQAFELVADNLAAEVVDMLEIAETICNEMITVSLQLVKEQTLQHRHMYRLIEERPKNPGPGEAMPPFIWKFGARIDGESKASALARQEGEELWNKLKRMRVSYVALNEARHQEKTLSQELEKIKRLPTQGGARGGSGHTDRPETVVQEDLAICRERINVAEGEFAAALAEIPSNASFDPSLLPRQKHPIATAVFRKLHGKIPLAATGEGFDIDVASIAKATHEVTSHILSQVESARPRVAYPAAKAALRAAIVGRKDQSSGGVELTPRSEIINPHHIFISTAAPLRSGVVQLSVVSRVFDWQFQRSAEQNSTNDSAITPSIARNFSYFERDAPLALAVLGQHLIALMEIQKRDDLDASIFDTVATIIGLLDLIATAISLVPGLQVEAGLLKFLSICAELASAAAAGANAIERQHVDAISAQEDVLDIGDAESSWNRYAAIGAKIGHVPRLTPLIGELVGTGLNIAEILGKLNYVGSLWMLAQMADIFDADDELAN